MSELVMPGKLASVSVVIPCHNNAHTLPITLASVAAQTVPPAEIICVDDGSRDDTVALLKRLQESLFAPGVMKVIVLPKNVGAAAARNHGMNVATQDYIAFLDADDIWHERKIEIQMGWMQQHPDADFSGHPLCWFRDATSVEAFRCSVLAALPPPRLISVRDMLISNRFPTPSVILKRSIPLRFSEDLEVAEDYEMWTRIIMEGYAAYFLDLPLMSLQKAPYGDGGLTQDLQLMIDNQMLMLGKFRERGKITWLMYVWLRLFFHARHWRRVLRMRSGGFRDAV